MTARRVSCARAYGVALLTAADSDARRSHHGERADDGGDVRDAGRGGVDAAAAAPPELIAIGRRLQPYAYVGAPLFVRGRTAGVMAFGSAPSRR